MELINDILPPLPNICDIGPEETKESLPISILIPNKAEIHNILTKNRKTPDWESSTEKYVTIVCNFNHTTNMDIKKISSGKVRCSECRLNINKLSEIMYSSGIDGKIFTIIRIDKHGQVVLRCVSRDHKMVIIYDMKDLSQEIIKYCPECVVEDLDLSDSDEMEECFDCEDDLDFYQHDSGGECCSDNDYENYFDNVSCEDSTSVNDVVEELEDPTINLIISDIISQNNILYGQQKEKAHQN